MTWAAVAVGGASVAGAAASSAGGKKGSKQSSESRALTGQQARLAQITGDLAKEQADLTRPLRTGTANVFGDFLKTQQTPGFLDLAPTVSPLAALSLPGLESEQQILRNTLLSQGSRGGMLQQQLAQAALQGGIQRSGLQQQDLLRQEQRDVDRSGIRRTLFGGAADMGSGGLSQAFAGLNAGMAGFGQSAANMNSLGSQRILENMQVRQGFGQLTGMSLGSLLSRKGTTGGAGAAPSKSGSGGSAVPQDVLAMFGGR